jgi:putative oxygen-independent coproporphyrinogen III oxidase
MSEALNAVPLALYVHLPWCVRKCPYCDFNSHEARGALDESGYLSALRADLEASLPLVWGRQVQSIFIGGGTPSLFSPEAIDELLAMCRAVLKLAPDAEVTLEANPGAVDEARFAGFAAAGVNRVSIGVQSFHPEHLKALGRVHDSRQAISAAEQAARYFRRFNLDLMYALPGQSVEQCMQDIHRALEFAPEHLSVYQLTIEPNTQFAVTTPRNLPDDDTVADMQFALQERLAAAGLLQYEVSAYAKAGAQSRHNRNYWEFGDYLGIGAGAHGKLTLHDRVLRTNKIRHPEKYMQQAMRDPVALGQTQEIPSSAMGFEFMLNALRLRDGVASQLFEQRTRVSVARLAKPMQLAIEKGLLDPSPLRFKATELGWRFLNDLQALFLEQTPSVPLIRRDPPRDKRQNRA